MAGSIITQDELKELLHYNPNTGIFTWLVSLSNRVKIGEIAGCFTGSKGYCKLMIKNKSYAQHRLAWLYMTGSWPKDQIDHINGIRDDNRFINLREASGVENQRNKKINKSNTSNFKGVYFHKLTNKWAAQASLNNKVNYLGLYCSPEEASIVYQEFVKKHHGEFYRESLQP